MASADDRIKEVLERYGEPFTQGQGGNVWRVQGTAVISHKTLERIAAQADIEFDKPQILRAERDEAVILVTGHICAANATGGKTKHAWSIGEALVNVNYRVSGKQAAYVYAMAEKRAKDRVILKLVELHGLAYSEEEADQFSAANQGRQDEAPLPPPGPQPMSVDHMLYEIGGCAGDAGALAGLKADPGFRAGYRAADEVSRRRIEQALAAAAEECAA